MLSFDIREVAERAVHVQGVLPATDAVWEEGDARPATDVRVSGRLSAAGADRFYFSGRIEGEVNLQCRRCLTDVAAPVSEEVHFLFTDADDREVGEDQDVYRLPPRAGELDMRPAVREQWLLVVPTFAECREDCKGLCPRCGADLNAGPCECPPEVDSRWAALRTARGDAE
jgi:uncharacterized protein